MFELRRFGASQFPNISCEDEEKLFFFYVLLLKVIVSENVSFRVYEFEWKEIRRELNNIQSRCFIAFDFCLKDLDCLGEIRLERGKLAVI